MENIFCVEFSNMIKPYYGYIKPWNGVRDDETYSLTYLPPSFINGIEEELKINGHIVRHKLTFDKSNMGEDLKKCIVYLKNDYITHTIHKRHTLINPKIILGFDNYEDAKYALTQPLYFGQNIYPIYGNIEFGIVEMTNDEFSKLDGVETILTDENDDDAIYVGNNRQRNNERMFVRIYRNEWYDN